VPTSTVEQYIKTIYQQEERSGTRIVQMKHLSDAMEVTPGTATTMVKHLADRALVSYLPRKGVSLTARGRKLALCIVRRHRLIETFLEQVLGYDWSEVHEDADLLEHAVSERFVQRLDAYLGYPDTDPHGDPIPSPDGVIETKQSVSLDRCTVGSRFQVSRVGAADPEFLALMKEHRVVPGEAFTLEQRNDAAGTLTLQHCGSGNSLTIGLDLGSRISVTV
jgi:DtxR family transcriptional regulator, Mn-dependent transcriptional regulator